MKGLFDEPTHKKGNQLDQIFTNMKILKKKSGTVIFTDHKFLRACLETRLEDETMDIVEEGGKVDQGKVNEREIIEKITNKRLNTVS